MDLWSPHQPKWTRIINFWCWLFILIFYLCFLFFRLRQQRCFYVILASFLPTHSFCLVVPWWSNIRYFDSHRSLDILERHHPRFISTGGTWILIFWFFWKDFVHVTFPGCCMLALFMYCPYSMRKLEMGTTLGRGILVWPRSIWSCGIVDQIETFFFLFGEVLESSYVWSYNIWYLNSQKGKLIVPVSRQEWLL
jgi:hypothetical protein